MSEGVIDGLAARRRGLTLAEDMLEVYRRSDVPFERKIGATTGLYGVSNAYKHAAAGW